MTGRNRAVQCVFTARVVRDAPSEGPEASGSKPFKAKVKQRSSIAL
jgi:hypothetical protein